MPYEQAMKPQGKHLQRAVRKNNTFHSAAQAKALAGEHLGCWLLYLSYAQKRQDQVPLLACSQIMGHLSLAHHWKCIFLAKKI